MKKIINNIQESRCSFKLSKILKDTGFECETNSFFISDKKPYFGATYNWNKKYAYDTKQYSRPTHSHAIEWVRRNFGWNICVKNSFVTIKQTSFNGYSATLEHHKKFDVILEGFNSPDKAKEKALIYFFENILVKKQQ